MRHPVALLVGVGAMGAVRLDLAEIRCEGKLLLAAQCLAWEDDDVVGKKGRYDCILQLGRERPGKIDAGDPDGARRREPP